MAEKLKTRPKTPERLDSGGTPDSVEGTSSRSTLGLEDLLLFCKEAEKISNLGADAVRDVLIDTFKGPEAGCFLGKRARIKETPEALAAIGLAQANAKLSAAFRTLRGLSEESVRTTAWLMRNQAKALGFPNVELTDDELVAIQGYTGSQYMQVNDSLRQGGAELKRLAPHIELLKQALQKLPPYQGLVRRGSQLPKEVLNAHQVGNVVEYPSFVSTSYKRGFGNSHRVLIYSNTCKRIDFLSSSPDEAEVLCPPGTRFKVLDRSEVNNEVTVIMREVPKTGQ